MVVVIRRTQIVDNASATGEHTKTNLINSTRITQILRNHNNAYQNDRPRNFEGAPISKLIKNIKDIKLNTVIKTETHV